MSDKTLVERLREVNLDCGQHTDCQLANVVGVDCTSATCAECGMDTAHALADAIEREYLPRPRFEDGTVVEVGDVVLWSGCKVKRVEDVHVEVCLEGACGTYNSVLKRPNDTLERIEDDVNKLSGDYWGCTGIPCSICPAKKDGKTPRERYGTGSCPQAMTIDLLRRQREVLERGHEL